MSIYSIGQLLESVASSPRFGHAEPFLQEPEIGAATAGGNLNFERVGALSTFSYDATTGLAKFATAASAGAVVSVVPRTTGGPISRVASVPYRSNNNARAYGQFVVDPTNIDGAVDVQFAIGFGQTSAADYSTDANQVMLRLLNTGELQAFCRVAATDYTLTLAESVTFEALQNAALGVIFDNNARPVFLWNNAPLAVGLVDENGATVPAISSAVALIPKMFMLTGGTNAAARAFQVQMLSLGAGPTGFTVRAGGGYGPTPA